MEHESPALIPEVVDRPDDMPNLVNDFGCTPDFKLDVFDENESSEEDSIPCEEPPTATVTDNNLLAVMSEDSKIAKTVLNNLKSAWKKASTIEEVCKLSLTTMKVLEQRRNLMNLQLGMVKTFAGGQGVGYGAYDA